MRTCTPLLILFFARQCSPQDGCFRFDVPNGDVSYTGITAIITCYQGYILRGSAALTCVNGRWNLDKPRCDLYSCQRPRDIRNGQMTAANSIPVGGVVSFTCDAGYRMEGSPTMICQEGNRYNNQPPRCVDSSCGQLNPRDRQQATYTSGNRQGSVATFSCYPGFLPSGAVTSVCQVNGRWTSPPPLCYRTGETAPAAPTWSSWSNPGGGGSWSSWNGGRPDAWNSWNGGQRPWSSWNGPDAWSSWSGPDSWSSWNGGNSWGSWNGGNSWSSWRDGNSWTSWNGNRPKQWGTWANQERKRGDGRDRNNGRNNGNNGRGDNGNNGRGNNNGRGSSGEQAWWLRG